MAENNHNMEGNLIDCTIVFTVWSVLFSAPPIGSLFVGYLSSGTAFPDIL
jgi:hypothetical protein